MYKMFSGRTLAISVFMTGAIAGGAWATAAPPTPQISKDYAMAQIVGDNYTEVSNLQRVAAGWTANAMESGKPVALVVSDMGVVDKQ